MRYPRLAFGGLLLAAPFFSHAQSATPRFSVGLAAYRSYFQPIESRPAGVTGLPVPLQLTAGYQLRPRLAVQVGVAYSGSSFSYDEEGHQYTSNGTLGPYYRSTGRSQIRTTSVSALARYTLTRKPEHRMQFDALGGLGLAHRTGSYSSTRADSIPGGLQTSSYSQSGTANALLLTAGLGTRYRLSPRVELTFDYTVNYQIPTERYSYNTGFTSSVALGVRYRFGIR